MSKSISDEKVKVGQIYKSKTSGIEIQILKKASGNRHWLSKKVRGGRATHRIHEGTLKKYYEAA